LYHNVEARGEFDPDRTVYLDNRLHQGRAGYQVVSPLKIAGSSRYVLVERGWVAAGPDRRQLPPVVTPAGEVDIAGVATPANPPVFELSEQVQAGKVWQNLTVDRYRSQFALDLQPTIIQQHSDLPDGLVRDWQPPSLGIERHRAYALQWFSMALAILILYVVLNVRRRTPPA
jgi:surfeit locus 1 family protein